MTKTHLRSSSKGQVTIPIAIRQRLKIDPTTLLDVDTDGDQIIIRPLNLDLLDKNIRVYSTEEIDQFLAEDKLSAEDATYFRNLLQSS